MNSYTINIGSPLLNSGDHFYIRYQTYPGGLWTVFGNLTSNSFNINLNPDTYRFEVTYVLASNIECEPAYFILTAVSTPVATCECVSVSEAYISIGCDSVIKMNVTFVTPLSVNCGVRIGQGVGQSTLTYSNYINSNLPSPLVYSLQSSSSQRLTVDVFCCDTQTWLNCYDEIITDIRRCTCDNAPTITNETLTAHPDGSHTYCVTYTASSPDENPYHITFHPNGGSSNVFHATMVGAATVCFNIPSGIEISAGKWSCTVSNSCGSDSSNGL